MLDINVVRPGQSVLELCPFSKLKQIHIFCDKAGIVGSILIIYKCPIALVVISFVIRLIVLSSTCLSDREKKGRH